MSSIAIIGGHGKIALQLSRLLAREGHEVTSIIRKSEQAADVSETGATALVADVESADEERLKEILAGHDAVVWSAGAGGGSPERTLSVDRDAAIRSMDAAQAAGVGRYIMVSYFGAGPDHGVPEDNPFFTYAEAKTAADAHLRESGLDWTILQPSTLSDEPGTSRIDTAASTSSDVPREDVARVIEAVLARPETAKRTIRFNHGQTPISEALA